MWRIYAINRLSNLNIKYLNEEQITSEVLHLAFMPFEIKLSKMALQLPKFKLVFLLGEER